MVDKVRVSDKTKEFIKALESDDVVGVIFTRDVLDLCIQSLELLGTMVTAKEGAIDLEVDVYEGEEKIITKALEGLKALRETGFGSK